MEILVLSIKIVLGFLALLFAYGLIFKFLMWFFDWVAKAN